MTDSLRQQIKQFFIKQQSDMDVAETLTGSDVKFDVEELNGTYERVQHERNPLRGFYGSERSALGLETAEIVVRAELFAGGEVGASAVPPQKDLLVACGHVEVDVDSIAVSLGTLANGPFRPGEVIDDGSTTTGRFIALIGSTLYFIPLNGTFQSTDTLTGALSGASIDASDDPAAAGKAYVPSTTDILPFTAAANDDGLETKGFGLRGDGSIEVEGVGQPAYIRSTLTGAGIQPDDVPLPSPVTVPTIVPETFLSSSLIAHESDLCVDGFVLNFGNEVNRRTCVPPIGRIRNRAATMSIEPDATLEADIPFNERYKDGDIFGVYAQVGVTAGHRMAICAPAAQYSALPKGERNNDVIYNAELRLTAVDGDDEYLIAFF